MDYYNPYKLKWGDEIQFPSSKTLCEYGNRIYNRYPARSIFLVPRSILYHEQKKNIRVLDPFMGSGTTAVETILSGNIALGVEMDPFARMISSVSSTIFKKNELNEIEKTYNEIINNWPKFEAQKKPDLKGIERWFSGNDLEQLLQLKHAITEISKKKYIPFFLIAFADCIKPVSLMERQSLKPYISRKYKKQTKPVDESFKSSFEAHFNATSQMSNVLQGKAYPLKWLGNDATSFPAPKELADIAITSPPYINALDYTRCIKIESAMCDLISNDSIQSLHKCQIGHEARRNQTIPDKVKNVFFDYYKKINAIDEMRAQTAMAFFNDIFKNLNCVKKALKDGAVYHMIIGDNNIRKIFIPSHEIIAHLAEEIGFHWIGYYKYQIKDHRMSIPRNSDDSKINYEHVIMLKK